MEQIGISRTERWRAMEYIGQVSDQRGLCLSIKANEAKWRILRILILAAAWPTSVAVLSDTWNSQGQNANHIYVLRVGVPDNFPAKQGNQIYTSLVYGIKLKRKSE